MWIPLETAFVNPDNTLPLGAECLSPNVTREECEDDTPKYFTDEDLLARFYKFFVTQDSFKPSSFRIPNCFLLIGGIIAVLSVLGLLLVREPEKERKTEEKLLDDSELPSLNAKEVLRTALFYKVALSTNN